MIPKRFRKRIWDVGDFAAWMEISHKSALALLKTLNTECGGMLLRTTGGKRPTYTFFVGSLKRSKPEIFERIESLEGRVEQLEEQMSERTRREKLIAVQTSENTRKIAKLEIKRAA